MPLLKIFITVFFCLLFNNGFSQKLTFKNPFKNFIKDVSQIDNADTFNYVIHRIIYDFNNDGKPDIAFSLNDTWGNAGGDWYIYLKQSHNKYQLANIYFKNGKMKTSNKILFNPQTASIKKLQSGGTIFTIYNKLNCCSGNIEYYFIIKNKVCLYRWTAITSLAKTEDVSKRVTKILKSGEPLKEEISGLNCLGKNINSWK